jgi:DNA-binding LacI/PurR family transcriptional regulator
VTRRRILEVTDEFYRRPSAAARTPDEGHTGTLGLIAPLGAGQLTFAQLELIASISETANNADLDILLSSSGEDYDRSFDRMLSERRVDGVILTEIHLNDPRPARLQYGRLPFVTIGRTARPDGMSWVDIDYTALVGRCVHHLADLGHRDIVLINRPGPMVSAGYGPAHRAREGFTVAIANRGINGREYCCADNARAGEACTEKILRTCPGVTAAVTINEAALPGMQWALERSGMDVPGRFSIAGVTAQPSAEQSQPPLTAADLPTAEVGAVAVKFLTELIADPAALPGQQLFTPAISLRSSTGSAKTSRGGIRPGI